MDILSFNKITKPKYEGGTSVDLKPRGCWKVEVRRTDGTTRYPLGDIWIPNVFLDAWANAMLNPSFGTNSGNFFTGGTLGSTTLTYTLLHYFYSRSLIAIGSGTDPALVTNTTLQSEIRSDSTLYPSGNSASWNSGTGNITWVSKREFPIEAGAVTYNEAGLKLTGVTATNTTWINGLNTLGATRLINRVVFPAPVALTSGEKLIISLAITIPSLASTAGNTITISAQNGVNISGVLKHISGQATMLGGNLAADGTFTLINDTNATQKRNQLIPCIAGTTARPRAVLSTKTAFDTLGTDPSWNTGTLVNSIWGTYTNDSRSIDAAIQFGSGTPITDTAFSSILIGTSGLTFGNNNQGGYQLLLDNQMTKASTAILTLSLRFTV